MSESKPEPTVSILHLEDSPADAEYFSHVLREGGLRCDITVVGNRDEFLAALVRPGIDLILSDNTLPGFTGIAALTAAREMRPELPFIFLSGSIGEEAAIETLKSGATDYILKHRASRLAPAVHRALKEKAEREEKRLVEEALRVSEERYALAALGVMDGLWDWDLKSGVIYFSPRWKTMLGYAEQDIGSNPEDWFSRIHPDDVEAVRLHLDGHLKRSSAKFECEYRILTKQGAYLWVQCRGIALMDSEGRAYRIAGSQGDIADRKRAEEQRLYEAFHDPVTGLANRNMLLNLMQRMLWVAKRKGAQDFHLICMGLDRFAAINESLGHLLGSELLKEAARRIETAVRPVDVPARLGGDEFALLMEKDVTAEAIDQTAEAVRKAFATPILIGGHEIFITVSLGVVRAGDNYQSAEEILRDGSLALGKAKALVGPRLAVFDASMHTRALALLGLETDLRHAVRRSEFRVHYQPIVSLATEEIAGFEALVRWQHPERGLVPPLEFIPLAEESLLINDIGRVVLEMACRQMREWHKAHPDCGKLTVSVNVSGRQFRQPDLRRQIMQALERSGLETSALKLEITETAIMDDPKAAADMLMELREAGISLQIDDFGTGYSSLGYLHSFPMHALKIDRSFVNLIGPQGENGQIASTIIAMAHNLGMQVIAEGIETASQLRVLKEMGCDFGQGYYFSKPVDEQAAEKLIRESLSTRASAPKPDATASP